MNQHLFILAAAFFFLASACQLDQDSGSTDVGGTVHDQPFEGITGFAETFGSTYVITLSDDPDFTCSSNPQGEYMSVEMSDVDGSGDYSAQGNVTFNHVNSLGVIEQQAATSGTFTVTVTTDEAGGEILEGSINASGDTSSVSGTFDVPVCD